MQQSQENTGLLTAAAMLAATLMIAGHIAGKAARDALFLTAFDISALPKMMMLGAAVSVVSVLLMSRLLTRYGPARLMPPFYLVSALLLAMQWYVADVLPQVAAVALYLHVSVINSILISGFWSTINERFDPYSAKKVIAKLTAATTFGGLLGGVAAKTVATILDTNAILLMLGTMHLVCAGAITLLARGQKRPVREGEATPNLLEPLKRSALIRRMALLGLLVATTAALLDYLLKAEASASLTSEELISFFSYFYMAVGLGTFLVQVAVGNRALRWLGLGGTMAAWPLAILVTGGGALVLRSLVSVTLMRASANLLYNSFFRAGFELLYTPIAPADKRTGKVLIDVGADRFGDMLGGLLVMAILLLPAAGESLLYLAALLLAAVCLLLILLLHRGYVRQLADNLRSGEQRAEELVVVDATTAHTVATTQTVIDRDQLLRDIAHSRSTAVQERPDPADTAPATAQPAVNAAPPASDRFDVVTESIIELRSGDVERIRRTLTSRAMTAELLPHALPLLADERVLAEALNCVRKLATSGAGQIVDALLNPLQHPLVKRRLPLILAHSESPLAVQGLTLGLDDGDWNVRFRCIQGLEHIRRQHTRLKMDEERLLRLAEAEARALSNAHGLLQKETPLTAGEEADQRRLHLLFLLFGALYEPENLELCLRALQSGDPALLGTALEYLENLLPSYIWDLLQPALAPGHTGSKQKLTLQQATRALLSAASSLRSARRQAANDEGENPLGNQ